MTDLAQKIADGLRKSGLVSEMDMGAVFDAIRAALTVAQGEAVAFGEGTKNGLLLEPDDLRGMMEWAGIGAGYDEGDAAALLLWIGEMTDDDGSVTYGLNARNEEVPEEGSWFVKALPRSEQYTDKLEQAEDALRSLACWLSVGGYNAEEVNAANFERRIRDGVNAIIEVEANRRAAPSASRIAELEREAERLREALTYIVDLHESDDNGGFLDANEYSQAVSALAQEKNHD